MSNLINKLAEVLVESLAAIVIVAYLIGMPLAPFITGKVAENPVGAIIYMFVVGGVHYTILALMASSLIGKRRRSRVSQ